MLDKMDFPQRECESKHVAKKLLYLTVGGAIGATAALLLAPKSGKELRDDIGKLAGRSYRQALATANQLKAKSGEYYDSAKEAGAELLNVTSDGFSAIGTEIREDMTKLNRILGGTRRGPGSDQLM